jgi:hypothetical protein
MALEQIMVEIDSGSSGHRATPNQSMIDWLAEVAEWKRGLKSTPGVSAVDMLLEDRRARR